MLDLVGRYQVQEKIGEGAMADVYRAYDPSIRRPLAIKVLKAEYCQDQEYASRFLREAKAAGALSHPNIVTIYDVGEIDGYPYIAMELLEGEPLNEAMSRQGKLPLQQILAIAAQLADALRYAHALGVVHRDIKPSNIMVGSDGTSIKILDFGIARVNEADGLLDADHLKTQIGQVLGTPRYMSPEQALGREIDGRSDLFSVGVVMYEMITGTKAFAGGSAATLALQITQQDPAPISQVAPECSRGLQFIVNKLLAKRPDRRFVDGAQLADALRREQRVLDTSAAEGGARRYLSLQLRVTLVMAVITAAVLAVAVGVVLVRQDQTMRRMVITSGAAMTSFVATNAALKAVDNATLPPDQRDWLPVQAFVNAASADKNVLGVQVVDSDGVVRGASDPSLVGAPYRAPAGEKTESGAGALQVSSFKSAKGQSGFRFIEPITYAGRSFGKVDVAISKSELESASALTRTLMTMLGVVVLGVVAAATYAVSRLLVQPLGRLKEALNDGAGGDLNFRISHDRTDEFGELFDAFNRFSTSVGERLENVEAIALDQAAASDEPVKSPEPRPRPRKAASKPDAARTAEPEPDNDRTMIDSPFNRDAGA